MEGWIKLHRKLLNWRWRHDPIVFSVFTNCLLLANYEEKAWGKEIIPIGSFITSLLNLSQEVGISVRQTRTALQKLQETKEIVLKSTNKYTVLTVCNYASYQGLEYDQRQTNDKQTTNKRQTNDKQTTITKEYNNIINKENKENKENKYILSNDNNILKESFSFKKELISKGCTEQLTNDYIAVRNRKKAPLTRTAFDGLIREFVKVSSFMSFSQVIETCVDRNWIGFKAEWVENNIKNNGRNTTDVPKTPNYTKGF